MKRLITLLLAAGIVLGAGVGSSANAVEIQGHGTWNFMFGWMDDNLDKHNTTDRFYAAQRIRPEFKFITEKNLSATLQFEIGKGVFGEGPWGMGADANNAVKFRYGYVDWKVPGTDVKVRMGSQKMTLPYYSVGAFVFGGVDIAGISVAYKPIDNLALNLFWARPSNQSINSSDEYVNGLHDTVDVFALAATYKGDGFKISPNIIIAPVGSESMLGKGDKYTTGSDRKYMGWGLLPINAKKDFKKYANGGRDSGTAWWAGIGGELTMFDPFKLAADFAYGAVDLGSYAKGSDTFDLKRKGWAASLLASYKLDMVTPGLAMWYTSGDDSNPYDGSERIPYIFQDIDELAPVGFDDGFYGKCLYSQTFEGTWGLQLRFSDISFVESLKHDLRFTYWKGTNDKAMAKYAAGDNGTYDAFNYMTEKDSAWMINLDNKWKIYKNLTLNLQLAYMKFDFDSNVWGDTRPGTDASSFDDSMYLAAIQMIYKF